MKLDVPFFKQTTSLNCGPTALRMVLAYFGKDKGIKFCEEKTDIEEGKILFTIQIATAAASLGYRTDFYSKHILFNDTHLTHSYYQNYGDMDLEQSKKLVAKANVVGVNTHERVFSLEELLKFVAKDHVPIVLLDWNVINVGKYGGYVGHFVPIVGYDKQNVYVHNQFLNGARAFMPISKDQFDAARKAEGTDEDFVVIYKK